MGSATSKQSYIPFEPIVGKKNADGTYTLQAGDMKRINDTFYYITKMLQGGLNLANMTSDAAAVLVTDDSITMEVSNGTESSTVTIKNNGISIASVNITFTGVVTFTDLSGSGSTVINGDNITTGSISANRISAGTLNGFTITGGTISGGTYQSTGATGDLYINSGNLYIRLAGSYVTVGHISWDSTLGAFVIESAANQPLKLISAGNMSLDSDGTIYIGASASYSNDVYIGRPSGGRIDLYGDVYINGVLQT